MKDSKTKFNETSLKNFERVLIEISENGKSLRQACLMVGMHRRDFHNMVNKDDKLFDHYARAREEREDFLMDEIYSIADDNSNDTILKVGRDGEQYEEENREWLNRSKLKVDVRKWHLSKMNPKKYGDKIEVDGNVKVKHKVSFK